MPASRSRYPSSGLLLGVATLLLFFLSACNSTGPQRPCDGSLQSAEVEKGTFVLQVQEDGDCNRWQGEAWFDPAVIPRFRRPGKAFLALLEVSVDEGPRIRFGRYGAGIEEGSYEVADIANTERGGFQLLGRKVSVGSRRIHGHAGAFSKWGTVTVEKVQEEEVIISFEVTLISFDYYSPGEEPPEGEKIEITGRFSAVQDSTLLM